MWIIIKLIASFGFDAYKVKPIEAVDLIQITYRELSINMIKTVTNFFSLSIFSIYYITITGQLFL